MAAYAVRRSGGPILRSISPSPLMNRRSTIGSPPHSNYFSTAGSMNRNGSRNGSGAATRSNNLYNYATESLTFSLDRAGPNSNRSDEPVVPQRKSCMCSPTNHPGSFRCSFHKAGKGNRAVTNNPETASSRLHMRRSAMKNSVVRIGAAEGDLVRRALAALIRPSSHQQRRRVEFRPRTSRLAVMSKE